VARTGRYAARTGEELQCQPSGDFTALAAGEPSLESMRLARLAYLLSMASARAILKMVQLLTPVVRAIWWNFGSV
jgi:hypothetical protein